MARLRLFLTLLAAMTLAASEPLVIIVNPESGVTQMTREEVTNIFMGRQKRLASGQVALPVELVEPEDERNRFYLLLVNLPLAQVRAHWARLYFSGQAQPPRQAQSAAEVLELVAANKGAVGFVPRSKATRRVKVVLTLGAGEDLP
jgi:ABC-type phosphate transport system substrate-binding protein